ncbi:MAG: glycosyltransferase family 9 protein [archaeon]
MLKTMNRTYYELLRFYANLKVIVRLIFYFLEYLSWAIFNIPKTRKYPKKIKKVLVYNQGPLGDFFSSLKVLLTVIKQNPNIEFHFCIVDEVKKSVKSLFKKRNLQLVSQSQIKNKFYDLGIILTPDQFTRKLKNLGFTLGNEYHSIQGSLQQIFKTQPLSTKIPPWWRHKIKQEIEIYKQAKLLSNENLTSFKPLRNKKVLRFLKSKKIKGFMIFHPTGRNFSEIIKSGKIPALSWSLERFAEIADYVSTKYDVDVILTGSKDEKFIGQKIISLTKNKRNIFNLAGFFTIGELAYLASRSDLILSIDTSMVHLGELVDSKIIALFGPTFVEEIGAYGDTEKQINLGHPEKCIRDRRKGPSHDKENKGMNSITTEEVKKAIDQLLR